MENQKYLEELQEKRNTIAGQLSEAQQQVQQLSVIATKLDGAIEHQQYVIEQSEEKQEKPKKK